MRLWRNWNPWVVLTGLQNSQAIVENRLMVPQKVNTDLPSGPPITPRNIPKRRENEYSKKYMYTHVLMSTTAYSETKGPLVDEQTICDVSMWRDIIQPQKRKEVLIHATAWTKKPDTKGRVSFNCIYIKCPGELNPETEHRVVTRGCGWRDNCLLVVGFPVEHWKCLGIR